MSILMDWRWEVGVRRRSVQLSINGLPNEGRNGKKGTEELSQREPTGHEQNRILRGVMGCEGKGVTWTGCHEQRQVIGELRGQLPNSILPIAYSLWHP